MQVNKELVSYLLQKKDYFNIYNHYIMYQGSNDNITILI